jgi:hypothetical protein
MYLGINFCTQARYFMYIQDLRKIKAATYLGTEYLGMKQPRPGKIKVFKTLYHICTYVCMYVCICMPRSERHMMYALLFVEISSLQQSPLLLKVFKKRS